MYAYLKGTVADKGQNELVLDVQDVGYLLFVSMTTLQETPPVGKTMKLWFRKIWKKSSLAFILPTRYTNQTDIV